MLSTVQMMLVEDHIVLREGLRRSLEANGVSVVAEVSDGNEVLAAAQRCQPDVVLMDLSLPGQDGISATRQLKQHVPDVPVIILSMFADEDTVRAAFVAGAVGYLVKDCSTAEMVSAVTMAALGSTEVGGSLTKAFLRGATRRDGPNTVLTRRESRGAADAGQRRLFGRRSQKAFYQRQDSEEPLGPHLFQAGRDEPDPSRGQGRKVGHRPYWLSRS